MNLRPLVPLILVLVGMWLLPPGVPAQKTNSDHFDGEQFFNLEGGRDKLPVWDLLKWGLTRDPEEWTPLPVTPSKPPGVVEGDDILATWVGHATLLIQWAGLNILTDPQWSNRASPVSWAGPRRWADPGIRFEDLPRIDAVLISHNHYDHMDETTLLRLQREHHPKFFVPLGNKAWFEDRNVEGTTELDWWESRGLAPLEIHCVPVRHFSGRSLTDRNETLWSGWILRNASGSFFFAGDTGYTRFFPEIGKRFGPIRLAALPIGAYEPRWFMAPMHINPEEAVRAHLDLHAQSSVGIHFNTFRLTDEPRADPPLKLREAMESRSLPPDDFWIPRHGESRWFIAASPDAP